MHECQDVGPKPLCQAAIHSNISRPENAIVNHEQTHGLDAGKNM